MKTTITLIALIITPCLCFSQIGSEVDKRQQEEIDKLRKDVDALRKEISSLSSLKSEVERTKKNQNSNIASNKRTLEEKLAIQDSVLNQRMELIREEVNEAIEINEEDIRIATDKIDDAIPVGSIIAFHLPLYQLPDNWILCDGRKVNDPTSIYFGKRVPNLVGYFIRGKMNSENIDEKGGQDNVASHSHGITSHTHEVGNHTHSFTTNPSSIPGFRYCTNSNSGLECFEGNPNSQYFLAAPTENAYKERTLHSHSGTTGNASSGYTQSGGGGSTNSAGEHSNIPEYKAFNFIIKIK